MSSTSSCHQSSCTKTGRISLPVQRAATAEDWPFLRALDWLLSLPAFCRWLRQRQRERGQLLELEVHLLDDIGLTREQAQEMGSKPFWKT